MSTSSRLRSVAPAAVPAQRRFPARSRAAVAVTGELLMTAGVILLLYAVYVLYGTGLQTAQAQTELRNDLTRTWAAPSPPAPPAPPAPAPAPAPAPKSAAPTPPTSAPVPPSRGEAVALLRLPRFGDFEKVVVEGTDRPELKKGPGHQPGTAMPGQLGNVVLAGHRTTYGAPFGRLDELRAGDDIVVQTVAGTFTYRVRTTEVVAPSAVEVMLPVPGRADATPTESLITLITCTPKYSARNRLVVRGALASPAAGS
jgi:sortase A